MEKQLNGKVAVRCHGYITIPAEREDELRQDFQIDDWNRPRNEYAKASKRRQPFRAIIKDLVTEDLPLTERVLKKILKDLKKMLKVGVYPMDVVARNYKRGLLIDFDVSLTTPHYLFYIKPPWRVSRYMRSDLISWQKMVKEQGITMTQRAIRNVEYCRKHRSYTRKQQETSR